MKQLTCEMCGSTDLVKQDGVFVCQACGCKYSIEEAKKMMVEGTVEVAGTVKVDDSSKIGNYYTMAENAYDAGNKQEAENYCNKIIEIDPTDYKAWFLKGKAAGWQSTLRNVRIEESVNCFTKAIDNAPEDKIDEIKKGAADEISSLSQALMRLCCNNFAKYPSEDNENNVLNNLHMCQLYSLLLLSKCGVEPTEFYENVADMINTAQVTAWNDVIMKDYKRSSYPSDFDFETFIGRCFSCISLLEAAISISGDGNQNNIVRYKNLIFITENLESACSYQYYDGGHHVNKYWKDEKKAEFIDKIMEYHEKIKELDPSHEVPQRPNPTKSGGCYVATAVYGSYDCPQVWTLRRFRDYTLAESWYGRAFIHAYYAISPTLVKWFGNTNWFKRMWQGPLDRMVAKLQSEGVESTPYNDREW